MGMREGGLPRPPKLTRLPALLPILTLGHGLRECKDVLSVSCIWSMVPHAPSSPRYLFSDAAALQAEGRRSRRIHVNLTERAHFSERLETFGTMKRPKGRAPLNTYSPRGRGERPTTMPASALPARVVRFRRRWHGILLLVAILAGRLPGASAATEDARLDDFFHDYLSAHFQLRPLEATQLGDHRYDHLLEDLSTPGRQRWTEHARKTLEALPQQVEFARLSRAARIDFEIFRHSLITTLWLADHTHPYEEDPRVYNSYISDSTFLLLTQSTAPKELNVSNCLARMSRLPAVLEAAKNNLRNPPRPLLETAIRQNRGAIAFYEKGILDLAGETPQRAQFKTASARVAEDLREYQKFLEGELLSRASGDWRLGKEKFSQKLDLVLDAGLTADQVLADAEREYERVHRDLYVLARQVWSRYEPRRPLPPDDAQGRHDTIQSVLQTIGEQHGRPEELVQNARATVERIKTFIRENNILHLPAPDRCQVVEMPEFKRGNALAYLESAPPLDREAASFYAISPPPSDWDAARVKSFLEEYNQHMLQILTIHEAYPGHYVQLEYSNRAGSLIRRVLQSGVMIEGWAVYTEQMMLDQGYGDNDPALRLSQLKFYLRAVVNALLDYRMHCSAMTDEEALKLLMDGAFQTEGEARLKILRSKQSSTQLSTYFVGRMAIYRLRQERQRELADKFDLARFHEAILGQGSVPVKYLLELVRAAPASLN